MRALTIGLLGLLIGLRAQAHDFWIEPSSFAPAPGQGVAVRLRVGEHFNGDPVGRPAELNRFVLVDAQSGASSVLPGRIGMDPAGVVRVPRPGAYVIGYHGKPNAVELPADKFNAYLKDEGLDAVLAWRAAHGQADAPGREIFSRCAKSLLRSTGDGVDSGPADLALGFPLELIAEQHSGRLRDGNALPLRLLYEGRPLAGALVVAIGHDDPLRRITQRSDADGRVRLPLDQPGPWMIKAVHMRPAPADSGAEWESLWASLSFAG